MIQIALCDDSEQERIEIRKKLEKFQCERGIDLKIVEYVNGKQLLMDYANQYDLIILDIEMSEVSGIQLAKMIREFDEEVMILFTTKYKQYAYDSFSVEPIGYLLKTEEYNRFEKKLWFVNERIQRRRNGIFITYQGNERFIELGKIVSMEYYEHVVYVYMTNGSCVKAKTSMKDILAQELQGLFMQINRNTIVNFLWVASCEKGVITMKMISKKYEVPRRKWQNINKLYLDFCRKSII